MKNTLTKLADKFGTDKGTAKHLYTNSYYKAFQHLRDKEITLFEIGINRGASLIMWRHFFPKAKILGIDLFDTDHYQANPGLVEKVQNKLKKYNIDFIKGDQTDPECLRKVIKYFNADIDIIIDDGSHVAKHQQITMNFLFPFLAQDGYYVIEDLNCQYSKDETETINIVKEYIKTGKWNSPFLSEMQNNNVTALIKYCKFKTKNKMVFLRKSNDKA